MTLATGLVLAIVVGTLAQKSDTLMAFFGGETVIAAQDDQFTVRAGKNQTLDVIANDNGTGALRVVDQPMCGSVRITDDNTVEFLNSESCSGDVIFSYCIEDGDACETSLVALSVINSNTVETPIAVAAVEIADEQGAEIEELGEEPEIVVATMAQGDRLTAGQLLLADDPDEPVVAGFGSDRSPTLFAPSMAELIQPQETVEVLRRSVEAIAPSAVTVDQSITTQRSTAVPTTTNIANSGQQDNLTLGTESSPMIAFSTPSQPRLAPAAPRLQPVSNSDNAIVIAHGPTVFADSPARMAIETTNPKSEFTNSATEEPVEVAALDDSNTLLDQDPSVPASNVDTQTANVNDIPINAADPADSSDIVVEMAAQILLPTTQLTQSLDHNDQLTPGAEVLLSDKVFVADLEASAPPAEEAVEVASIPPSTVTDQPATLAPETSVAESCDVQMRATARPGAEISLFISSSCRANEVVSLEHSGLTFTDTLDARGTMSLSIPALTSTAIINATFDDGTVTQSTVLVRNASNMERIVVMWPSPVHLELHAFEGTASEGSNGHVWAGNARKYRDTLTNGGGFIETLGDPDVLGGTMAEIYSLPTNRLRSNATVRMDLRIIDASGFCDNSMNLRTIRTANRGSVTSREFSLRMPQCGDSTAMVLENFVEAISVARQ